MQQVKRKLKEFTTSNSKSGLGLPGSPLPSTDVGDWTTPPKTPVNLPALGVVCSVLGQGFGVHSLWHTHDVEKNKVRKKRHA